MSMRHYLIILTLLTFSLQLNAQTDSLSIPMDSTSGELTEQEELIDPIETMPQFPGGEDSLSVFVENNNRWQVGSETIVGKVFVAFVVELDGSVTNIEIMRGLHPTCDEEAKRIVSIMPKWKPGEQLGTPVRTKLILPISFNGLK